MMYAPRVSIIMPAHNVQRFVTEAIDSIAVQTFQSFELILVDDGSTDATPEILLSAKESWPPTSGELKLLHQPNAGAACARNTGVAKAKGDLVAFIDADDRWSPDTLAHLVETLDGFPKCDIACPRYRRINEDGEEVNYLGEQVRATQQPSNEINLFDAGETLVGSPAESATGVLVRLDAFKAGGGFDTTLKSNNDIDCWLRILCARRSKLVKCGHAFVDYRIRSAQITSDVRRMQEGHKRFLRNHETLLRDIGVFGRMRHFGLVRAYWSLIAARHKQVGTALRFWLASVMFYPYLVLPGTLGSSAAFAIIKVVLPKALWQGISAIRRRLRPRT
ncbi:MAG: glycosyltransferase family 2 protein [Paracoccaceae bacterium]|nr:glycosyltransferase family 2 protein [Paracoccaceae bacterium]